MQSPMLRARFLTLQLVAQQGFEPVTSVLPGQHVWPLEYGSPQTGQNQCNQTATIIDDLIVIVSAEFVCRWVWKQYTSLCIIYSPTTGCQKSINFRHRGYGTVEISRLFGAPLPLWVLNKAFFQLEEDSALLSVTYWTLWLVGPFWEMCNVSLV